MTPQTRMGQGEDEECVQVGVKVRDGTKRGTKGLGSKVMTRLEFTVNYSGMNNRT